MAKRRLIQQLPGFQQTDDLTNFFGSTVDEVFQPGISDSISGYIGRVPPFNNAVTDFFVGEPTASRAAYQLEAGMISMNGDLAITNTLSYPDLVGYLSTEGANVTDQQRLFENEFYSWAPPINIDMLVNFRDYYWFGDHNSNELPILILTVPMIFYVGDGIETTYPLPDHTDAVPEADEVPSVYVNGLPVTFTIVGDNVVLDTAPANLTQVLVARTPDLSAVITDQVSVDISDLNTHGLLTLSSSMRVKIIDAIHVIGAWDMEPWDNNLWDLAGDNVYFVDGVGLGIRLTQYNTIIRGIEPQYITIDRSSVDTNQWSLHNSWVHKDTFKWSHLNFPTRQAVRPIIEFVRDLILFPGQTWAESSEPLFMLHDIDNVALNDSGRYPVSDFSGSRIFGYATGLTPLDTILHRSLAFDANGYILFNNDAFTIRYHWSDTTGTFEITSLYCYGFYLPTTSQIIHAANVDLMDQDFSSLWHPTITTSIQFESAGFFVVPTNLEANPLSDDITIISRSTWIDQFRSIMLNQIGITGSALGDNTYRDTARDLSVGSFILQHRAPLLKTMLTASDTDFDLPQAIRFVEQEYNRFRNKFIRRLGVMYANGTLTGVDPTADPDRWAVTALNQIKRDKAAGFPFALNTIGGVQYFIPPTPATLGVLSAAVPKMVTDTTYSPPVLMIQGHDGSLTPAMNDWRDDVLLSLETMIYDNLPSEFQTEARPVFDIQKWVGSRYFAPYNGYFRDEVTQILNPMFERWAQMNRMNYRSHDIYDPSDPFTFNFHGVADIFGNLLPGNWRAIYRFYYGTDSPHTRPWEMLGFVSEPSWWITTYGSAPYLRTNTALWTDLENGVIADGPRQGIDTDYARPGLIDLIPVNDAGDLLDPMATGIVTQSIPLDVGSRPWQAGDHGPVENIWINSPSYRFAFALASFLMKPARLIEECWDTLNIGYIGPQWVDLRTMARTLNSEQYVHGETRPDGSIASVVGIQQWIYDYLASTGKTASSFGQAIRGLQVRLLHQMAGFVSSDDMKVVADNFGLLPSEDVSVVFYQSPSTDVEVYSGVILEWTGRSWRVVGYDSRDPFFTIIPPNVNGPKGIISLATADEPSIVEWRPNAYFPVNVLAIFDNSIYQCLRSHTSGPNFENNFWNPRSDLSTSMIRAPRVVTYLRGLDTTTHVSYGTEFYSYQEVADFLLAWQRWLVSRGWIFDAIDPATGLVLDWSLSVREFLTWAQIQWQSGNFIALSPGMQGLKFKTSVGTILNVEDNITGFFGIVNRSGQPINERNIIINRLDGQIDLFAKESDIFGARLEIASVEHALVFSNVTIFDDDIYLPLFDMRQYRLRLICHRSQQWAGRLDAPGFVVIGNQLKSDFEKSANDVRLMFDIEQADVKNLRDYARHNIGFQQRDYLNNLLLSDTSQFEFYQGMIQQKGAPGVFSKLMRSTQASDHSDIRFLEEWAIRIGAFGAPFDPFVTFQITQVDTRSDPQIIRFISTPGAPADWIVMPLSDTRWFDKPASANFFRLQPTYRTVFPNAGPVRLSDVSYSIFHIADLETLYATLETEVATPLATGTRIWVYERDDGTFTVLESFETGSSPNPVLKTVSNNEDITVTTTRIYFQNPINMTSADVGSFLVVDGQTKSDPELHGIQTITAVNVSDNYVEVDVVSLTGFDYTNTELSAPFVRILREVRFATQANVNASGYVYNVDDLVWVDDFFSSGQWAVLQWDGTSWTAVRNQPHRVDPTVISETVIYHENVRIINKQMIANEPVVDVVDVIDPIAGLLAGVAQREIDFFTSYDPARYTSGADTPAANPWGAQQVGRVWWNLSTVKFLDPYTDGIGASNPRDVTELAYRSSVWAQVAPAASVDVYEWIRSDVDPNTYAGDPDRPGTVFNVAGNDADGPVASWVEETVFDALTSTNLTNYYFWVSGLTNVPDLPFRKLDIASVATAIRNPSALDLAWLAPIFTNAMIFSGVLQFLNDSDTVMKIRLTLLEENQGRHDEWLLMRPTDEFSLPPDNTWTKLRNSLAGFTAGMFPLPSLALAPTRTTGLGIGQNLFKVKTVDGDRAGLMDAREIFITSLNNIFAATAIAVDRQSYIATITKSNEIAANLIWSQVNSSYPFEEPPDNEWDIEVFTLDHRNQLVARSDFLAAVTSDTTIRVLLNGIGNPLPIQGWSIWYFNPTKAGVVIAANPLLAPEVALLQNADSVFDLAPSYEHIVTTDAGRTALVLPLPTISVGDRVLVTSAAFGFWALWKYMPSDPTADAYGFVLWRVQTYDTHDFISHVDWYETGYTPTDPPTVVYDTISERDHTEGVSPINLFVRVNDDGTPAHAWIWTVFDTVAKEWTRVATENGTIALSSNFYDPTRVVHGVNSLSITDIANRDGSWELYVIGQAVRFGGILLESEINKLWFDMLNFCHAQQADVNWAFKTSFMTIVGYNVPLGETPFVIPDQTNNLISYINEVKPYHVKIREFSTQYVIDVDEAHVTVTDFDKPVYLDPITQTYRVLDPVFDADILNTLPWQYWLDNYNIPNTPVRGIDISMLFDRYAAEFDGWDTVAWDSAPFDHTENTTSFIYVHTVVVDSLTASSTHLHVDDVRFLDTVYVNDLPVTVSVTHPLTINLGDHTYEITKITMDEENVSTSLHGASGVLTATSAITVLDGAVDNVVEAVIAMPSAAARIITSYTPDSTMTPNDLPLLLDLDMGAGFVNYVTTTTIQAGESTLTFATLAGVSDNQPIIGPNIIKGTYVSAITATTATLSAPTIGIIPVGTSIRFNLPNWVSGYLLQTFNAPVSEFDILPFDAEGFDNDTDVFGTTYSGGTPPRTVTIDINPVQTSRPGFGFIAPYYMPNHPQERVPFLVDDGLQLIVTADPLAGGPPQVIKAFDVSAYGSSTAILFFDLVAQAKNGIMVFRDGIRAVLDTDFTVDHLGRTVEVDITGITIVNIHAFGFGGTKAVNEQHFIEFSSNPISLNASNTLANVAVVEDGVLLNSSLYSVSGSNVTITTPPSAGTDVAVITYDNNATTATTMVTQTLTYNGSQQWVLSPYDTDTVPEHAGTIVEVNGQRLTPPTTYYGAFTADQPYMFFPITPDMSTTITVYVDNVLYSTPIPFASGVDPGSSYPLNLLVGSPPPTSVAGQFAIFENVMVALDPDFVSDNVAVVLEFVGSPPDYTVTAGFLTINPTLSPSDEIVATIFTNADSMGLKTVTYPVDPDILYIVPKPFAKDYLLVTMNGLALAPDFDYEIVPSSIGWDTLPFDESIYDFSYSEYWIIHIFAPTTGNIVATVATSQAARERMQWRASTNTPAFLRMLMHLDDDGHPVRGVPVHGSISHPLPLHDVSFEYIRQTPYMAGSLINPLVPTDSQMVVSLFLETLSPKLQDDDPLPQPSPGTPGVIWIEGERIEYFQSARSGDTVTLTGLRRGTRGTTIAEQRVVVTGTGSGAPQTYALSTLNGTGQIEVAVDGVQYPTFTGTTMVNHVDVVLTAPSGSFVTVAMTNSYTYPVGTAVYNGVETFAPPVPLGPDVGNREIQPMEDIITR
jgi:hypothetical protein